jgi:hypothetical protein
VILVEFDGYVGPTFPDCGDRIVPIYPVTRQFEYKNVSCSRTQFPLRLAYAITVHKSQGMSLSKAVMNLNRKQHCPGLRYVAVSRIREAGGTGYEQPFDFDRFKRVETDMTRDRELDVVRRSSQLL